MYGRRKEITEVVQQNQLRVKPVATIMRCRMNTVRVKYRTNDTKIIMVELNPFRILFPAAFRTPDFIRGYCCSILRIFIDEKKSTCLINPEGFSPKSTRWQMTEDYRLNFEAFAYRFVVQLAKKIVRQNENFHGIIIFGLYIRKIKNE